MDNCGVQKSGKVMVKKNIAIMESIEGSKRKSGVKMEEAYRASKQKIDYINENMGSHMEEKVL